MAQLTSYTPIIHIDAAGRNWTLERAADLETLWDTMVADNEKAEYFQQDERLPYWTELWPSSIVLADFLAHNAKHIQGRTCLDMGCGLGLCSLVGQWLGASVVGMDYEPEALHFARRNATINHVAQPLWTVMDWRAPAVKAHSTDIVWGGDIMYERRFVEPVLAFLDHVLTPSGKAWVAEPGRSVYTHFHDALRAQGWHAKAVHTATTSALYTQAAPITVKLWELHR
ncbi:MAG: 50S ribosomal protein L11 methyltransferase [Pseudomonadota bacterium]